MVFKVGELVIMQNASYYKEWNGHLGVVVGTLATRPSIDLLSMSLRTRQGYRVKILASDSMIVDAQPHQLRRLHDPDTSLQTTAIREEPSKTTQSGVYSA